MSYRLRHVLLAALLCAAPMCSIASDQIEAMLRKADAVRSSDPKQFDAILNQIEAAKAKATPLQLERFAYLVAYEKAFLGKYDDAIVDLKHILDTASDKDTKFRANALLINSYAVTRQFTDGLRAVEKLLPQAADITDPELRVHGKAVASLLYNQVGQYKLALRYADQILDGPISARSRCFAGQYRLDALQSLKALPADDAPIVRLIEECTAQHELVVANLVRGHLARKWSDEGLRGKAIDLLKTHMVEVEATRYPFLIGQIRSQLAEYLLAEGDLEAAEMNANAAIAQRADMQFSIYLVSAYRTLYELAQRRNDAVAALQHYRRYAEADKAYLTEVKTRELAYQIVRQEMLQKTQEIELLNRRNEVLQLQQRVDRQSAQSSRLLALLLTLLVGSIGYWAYKIKRVQNSLRRMAETDALTGICNRRHFSQLSERTLLHGARAGEDVALIMFDLDHFKSINDRFGHVTGDWVLRRVSDHCRNFCRRIDHLGRLGGEEFAILLSGCDLRGAMRVAEDCRVRIATIDTQPSGHKFVVTASFGVTATSLSGYDLAKLLSHADMMLYRAKREGRNRVCAFDGSTAAAPQETSALKADETASPRVLQIRPDATSGA